MKVERRSTDDFCSHCGEVKRTAKSSHGDEATPAERAIELTTVLTEMHAGIVEAYATNFPTRQWPAPDRTEADASELAIDECVAAEAVRRSCVIGRLHRHSKRPVGTL